MTTIVSVGTTRSPNRSGSSPSLAPPLWMLRKNGHTAEAHLKAIDGVGLELRFLIDGELRPYSLSASDQVVIRSTTRWGIALYSMRSRCRSSPE
jgi:hypothetical protein